LKVLYSTEEEKRTTVKKASTNFRPLSIRHAEEAPSVVQMIKDDPKVNEAVESHCEHSGGTKNIHTLIHFLRDLLGKDVSFSDEELKEYLEERKMRYKEEAPDKGSENVGRIGIDSKEDHDDDMADYMRYDGSK